MYKFSLSLFLLTFLLSCGSLSAQDKPMHQISLRDGLSGLSVTNILDDPDGRVWVSTSNGIDLYNGQSIISYGFKRKDNKNIFCFETSLSSDGAVYAATSSGLFLLHRYENSFYRICDKLDIVECVLVYGDKVYVGNRQGFFVVDRHYKATKISTNSRVNSNNSVRCIRRGPDGNVWFTTRNALNVYNPRNGKIHTIPFVTASGLSRFDFANGKVFVGTKNNGLYVMDMNGRSVRSIEGVGNIVADVVATPDRHSICAATDGKGAFLINGATYSIISHYGTNEVPSRRLPSDAVYSFHLDRLGVAWIGMFRHGLSHSLWSNTLFKTYSFGNFSTQELDVKSFYSTPSSMVIAGSGHFLFLDKHKGSVASFDTERFNASLLKSVNYLDGNYYIGSYDSGLLRFNVATRSLSRLGFPGSKKLSYATVSGITKDRQGKLWIATSEGLFSIDSKGSIRNYSDVNSKLFMGVRDVLFDSNGLGWIGTSKGVCIFLPAEGSIINSGFPEGFFNGESITFSQADSMIYGYSEKRIYYTDPSMKKFGEIALPDGIVGESCTDFMRDRHGTYWIVSEKGLFAYNAATHTVSHFGADLGLDCSAINPQTMYISKGDTLWIGTDNGLKYISLNDLDKYRKAYHFKVSVDGVTVDGTAVERGLYMKFVDAHRIAISWNIVSQRLDVVPCILDYSGDNDKVFEYSLDGTAKWNRIFGGEKIVLSNLLPGRHRLYVRLSGVPGTMTTYIVDVYPSIAAWSWFVMIVAAAGAFVFWIRQNRHNKVLIEEHQATEQALIEENKNEELVKKPTEDKYQKVRVPDRELGRIARMMKEYVTEKQPYLNQELKMSDIATALHVSPSMLSQVFTLYIKESYYDWINSFRLAEFKRRIDKGDHHRLTIQSISEECGFQRTSFFSPFRKVEGMTPTEYIKKKGK